MNTKQRLCLFAVLLVPSVAIGSPMSQGEGYGGLQLTQLTYDEDGISKDAEPTAIVGRFGYFLADQLAVEGRVGFGLASDTIGVDVFGSVVNVDVELDRMFGIYAVGHLPIGEEVSLYGLMGYSDAKATFSASGFSRSESDSGLSYGVGAEFYSSRTLRVNLEYTQYLDESGYDLSAIGVGVRLGF